MEDLGEGKGPRRKHELYEPSELNNLLEQFYAMVCRQDGTDYEPDSLRVMATAMDRHLKEKKYKIFDYVRDSQN